MNFLYCWLVWLTKRNGILKESRAISESYAVINEMLEVLYFNDVTMPHPLLSRVKTVVNDLRLLYLNIYESNKKPSLSQVKAIIKLEKFIEENYSKAINIVESTKDRNILRR